MRRAYTSLLAGLDRLPPNICRLIARDRRRPLTNDELAARSGLPVKRVVFIAKLKSWARVPVGQVDAFRSACGITPQNQSRHLFYLQRTFNDRVTIRALAHLDKLPARKAKRLLKLL